MVFTQILAAIGNNPEGLVISGMAPNIRGAWALRLCERVLDLASRVLRPGEDFLITLIRDEGFDLYLKDVRERFDRVQMRKPLSSRDCSREQYLLVCGFRGNNS